jgi:hypothetical protein
MFSANLERIRPKVSDRLITRALAHASSVFEHEQCIAHATCGESQYVLSNIGENPSKYDRTLNRALAHACAMLEHAKYIADATCGDA